MRLAPARGGGLVAGDAERRERARIELSTGVDLCLLLELAHGTRGLRSPEAIDRAGVDALRLQFLLHLADEPLILCVRRGASLRRWLRRRLGRLLPRLRLGNLRLPRLAAHVLLPPLLHVPGELVPVFLEDGAATGERDAGDECRKVSHGHISSFVGIAASEQSVYRRREQSLQSEKMHELAVSLALIGALVLALGLASRPLERLPVSGPLVALLAGVALGPQGLEVLHPQRWGDEQRIVEEAARLTIAVGLMAIALRLPPGFLARHWRSLAALLVLVMPLMALVGGVLVWALLGMPLLLALVVGALLCPTDPIVATSIVTGSVAERSLPERLRDLLLGESGANDGLAFPLVWLPLLLIALDPPQAWAHWLARTLAWEVGGAIAAGALAGHLAGRLLMWAEAHHTIEVASFFAYTIALTLFSLGAAELAGMNGILAVFASGLAFSRAVGERDRVREERVQDAINGFFTLPIFVLIGLLVPWEGWRSLGLPGVALAALILLLRRLPAVLLLSRLMPDLPARRDVLFAGWFGPIGVAALFYAMLAARHVPDERLWPLASLVICASVLVHGMTGAPFTLLYARRARDGNGARLERL